MQNHITSYKIIYNHIKSIYEPCYHMKAQLDASHYKQLLRVTDCLGAVWTEQAKEYAFLSHALQAPVAPNCTPLQQPTDTHLAKPAKDHRATSIYKSVKIIGNSCKIMQTFTKLYKTLENHAKPSVKSYKFSVKPCKAIQNHVTLFNLQASPLPPTPRMDVIDFHGFPWISIDFHSFSWISMDFHGFPWMFIDFH